MGRTPIVNALTGFEHTYKFVGSLAELEFYRVMPEGSSRKIFFDSADEYGLWCKQVQADTKGYSSECGEEEEEAAVPASAGASPASPSTLGGTTPPSAPVDAGVVPAG